MASITPEDRQLVKESVNIVDVIDQFVSLRKQGKNYFGFCPFHDERTPSFSVTAEKQLFKCFSCGRSGDVFSFFMEKDGLTFQEAVLKVAEIGNVPLAISQDSMDKRPLTQQEQNRQRLVDMHNIAADFYHHVLLHTNEGEQALTYIQQRGFTIDTIKQFKIGVSLASRRLLYDMLLKQGYTDKEMEQSGLFSTIKNQLIDRFFNRIMVPLRNEKGDVVAFSGRTYLPQVEDDTMKQPKYLNSPETSIFHKGTFLFNLDLARGAIRKQNEVILCEGYMDVIAVYQTGISNVLASMGTSLTDNQINQLKKFSDTVVLAYDGDNAGVQATNRAIELLQEQRVQHIAVVPMLNNMDPDEMIQTKGSDYFREHVAHEKETVFAFYKRFYKTQFSLSNQKDVLDYIDVLLKQLVKERSITARSLYVNELSKEFNVSSKALEEQLAVILKQTNQKERRNYQRHTDAIIEPTTQETDNSMTKKQKVEWQILKRLLTDNKTEMYLFNVQDNFQFDTEIYQKMLLLYIGSKHQHHGNLNHFEQTITDTPLRQLYAKVRLEALGTEVSEQEIKDLSNRQLMCRLEEQIEAIDDDIKEAKKANDTELEYQLLIKRINLMKKVGDYR